MNTIRSSAFVPAFILLSFLVLPPQIFSAAVAGKGQGPARIIAAAPIALTRLNSETASLSPSIIQPRQLAAAAKPAPQSADAFIDDFLRHVRDVSLRDGHQSLDGNRWRIEERTPIAALLNRLGLHSVESGGGADFDVATMLGENPFDNLRQFNRALTDTDQQWLFRGRNALGLGPQPQDVIAATVDHAVANGLKRIRVFDGMNDVDNIRSTVQAARGTGKTLIE